MKKIIIVLLVLCVPASLFADNVSGKKILIVVSNLYDMGDVEKHDARNNLWEVAPPYHVFVSQGYEVDFVSPLGGEVGFSMDPIGISSYTIKYENFLGKANASLTPEQLKPEDYSAVFIGGGYGPLFDVADNIKILSIIAQIYEADGIVGACGHGAGSFANVKLRNNKYMVEGLRVAGFPNSTEKAKSWAKQGTLLPFLVEDKLRENGAIALNKETLNDKNEVVIDQRVVTSMFLPSAALVAKEMINLLQKQ